MQHAQYILKCEELESARRNKSSQKIALSFRFFHLVLSLQKPHPGFQLLRLFYFNDAWNSLETWEFYCPEFCHH